MNIVTITHGSMFCKRKNEKTPSLRICGAAEHPAPGVPVSGAAVPSPSHKLHNSLFKIPYTIHPPLSKLHDSALDTLFSKHYNEFIME